jgi:hypothetical protein
MVLCANDLIVSVPLGLLLLWFALACWSPVQRRADTRPASLRERAWREPDRVI